LNPPPMSAHPAPRATRSIRAETAGSSGLALGPNQLGKAGGEVEASIPVMAMAHQRTRRRVRRRTHPPRRRPLPPKCRSGTRHNTHTERRISRADEKRRTAHLECRETAPCCSIEMTRSRPVPIWKALVASSLTGAGGHVKTPCHNRASSRGQRRSLEVAHEVQLIRLTCEFVRTS
jgi:hypothetical protein